MQQILPIVSLIEDAKSLFLVRYGFSAEKLHASTKFAHALQRWAFKEGFNFGKAIEIGGLEVVHMTKKSAMVDFYLSANRNGRTYSLRLSLEPDEMDAVGVKPLILPGEADLSFGED